MWTERALRAVVVIVAYFSIAMTLAVGVGFYLRKLDLEESNRS